MGSALSEMQVKSAAFSQHVNIPARHSGEAEDVSPQLSWDGAPDGTQSFAVFCHDPDAPLIQPGSYGFVHWLRYNLPASVTALVENDAQGTAGQNDFGVTEYRGPMPPEGHGPHHYYFWVLALDRDLQLEPGLNLWQFLERVEPHVTAMNRLVGTYQRG